MSEHNRRRFAHDCDRCTFLGQDEEHDFYACGYGRPGGHPTVIARYGDKGPQYMSGLEIAQHVEAEGRADHPLAKALRLARERGATK